MSLVRFRMPVAFQDLGVPFFLDLDAEASQRLQAHHVRETRRWHPDLLPPETTDAVRENHEARLSALNAAYLKLRDRNSRLDLVVDRILEDNPPLKDQAAPELPAALAMEYFELQEALETEPDNETTRRSLADFYEFLIHEIEGLSRGIDDLLREKYLTSLPVPAGTPFDSHAELPQEFVTKLLSLRNRERYLLSLQADLKNRKLDV